MYKPFFEESKWEKLKDWIVFKVIYNPKGKNKIERKSVKDFDDANDADKFVEVENEKLIKIGKIKTEWWIAGPNTGPSTLKQ